MLRERVQLLLLARLLELRVRHALREAGGHGQRGERPGMRERVDGESADGGVREQRGAGGAAERAAEAEAALAW